MSAFLISITSFHKILLATTQNIVYLSLMYSAVTQRHGTYPVVLYCHGEAWCLSLRYSTDTKRHGTCPCGALLSHKDTVPVRVVLYSHPEARCLPLLYSTTTQTHGICPCGTRLSPRDGTCQCCTQLSTRDTGPVPVVLSCQRETRDLSLWYSTVLMSHRYTVTVPVLLCYHPDTRYQSLWYSTVTQRHGACPCDSLLSPIDTVLYSTFTQRHDTVFVPAVFCCLPISPDDVDFSGDIKL